MDIVRLLRAHWDRAFALAALTGGIVALVAGYRGVSGTAFTAEQIPYIVSGAITRPVPLGVAATLFLTPTCGMSGGSWTTSTLAWSGWSKSSTP